MHDLSSKVIFDNQNRIIVKVDESYGFKNAGVIGQMTHGGASQFHSGPFRNSALYKGNNFDQSAPIPQITKTAAATQQKRAQSAADSSSKKHLLERKIYLIKKMIKNEKQANEMISNQLSHLTTDLHMNNRTVQSTVDLLKATRTAKVPQKL